MVKLIKSIFTKNKIADIDNELAQMAMTQRS